MEIPMISLIKEKTDNFAMFFRVCRPNLIIVEMSTNQ